MQIKIINNIDKKINEYQDRTGATKKWIAGKLDMSSARLNQIVHADNLTIDVVVKFAVFLDCSLDDLFKYEIIYDN